MHEKFENEEKPPETHLFAIDVHASQYGTPTRLLHAVRVGLVSEGWAIDEDTAIEAADRKVTVGGLGIVEAISALTFVTVP